MSSTTSKEAVRTAAYLLTDAAKAIGFHPKSNPSTSATRFVDACLASYNNTITNNNNNNATTKSVIEPPYHYIEQQDNEKYNQLKEEALAANPNETTYKHKTRGLQNTLGISEEFVLKTLIFKTSVSPTQQNNNNNPLPKYVCIVMHGNATVNTRIAARAIGVKSIQPLSPEDMPIISGYIPGGTSAFGLKTCMPIIIQSTVFNDPNITYLINGGGHYKYLLIKPQLLLDVFNSPYAQDVMGYPKVIIESCARKRDNIADTVKFVDLSTTTTTNNEKEQDNNSDNMNATTTNNTSEQQEQQQQEQLIDLTKYTTQDDILTMLQLLQQELLVLTSSYPENNATVLQLPHVPHQNTLFFSDPHFVNGLLSDDKNEVGGILQELLLKTTKGNNNNNGTSLFNDLHHIYHNAMPLQLTLYLSLDIPITSSSSPSSSGDNTTMSSFSPSQQQPQQQQRQILIQFSCDIPYQYPYRSIENIHLEAPLCSDFMSLFAHDEWCKYLKEQIAQNYTNLNNNTNNTNNKHDVCITSIINDITENYLLWLRAASGDNMRSPYDDPQFPDDANAQQQEEHEQHQIADLLINCDNIYSLNLGEIETWKWSTWGTWPLEELDKMTPEQRYVIYHQPLMGKLVLREKCIVVYDKIQETINKVQQQLTSSNYKDKTPLQLLPRLTTLDIVKYQNQIFTLSSPLRGINFQQGENCVFLQKKKSLIKIGLCGFPNVGKSSLFNILCKASVPASNYAFCTINPNHCVLPIVDERFQNIVNTQQQQQQQLNNNNNNQEILPAFIQCVDIAGILKGACLGTGLGNSFLHHISTVDVIFQVVRCFNDTLVSDHSVEHVQNTVDPIRDIQIINSELLEKDIELFYKRICRLNKFSANIRWITQNDLNLRKINFELSVLLKAHQWLVTTRRPLRHCYFTPQEAQYIATLQTLTTKPVCYILNMSIYQYCNIKQRNFLLNKFQNYFNLKNYNDVIFVPISIIYEQSRQIYLQRYLPFVNNNNDNQTTQYIYQTKDNNKKLHFPAIDINSENAIANGWQDDETLLIAAIGREIQSIRHSFDVVINNNNDNNTSGTDEDNKKEKEKDKQDKKEKEKEKQDKKDHKKDSSNHKDKKDKKSSSSSSSSSHKKSDKNDKTSTTTTTITNNDLDFGGGFADFLGDDLFGAMTTAVPEPTASKKDNKKDNKKDSKKENKKSSHDSDNNPEQPQQQQQQNDNNNTNNTTLNEYDINSPQQNNPQHPSPRFWRKVDAFLLRYPSIIELIKHIAQDDVDMVPVSQRVQLLNNNNNNNNNIDNLLLQHNDDNDNTATTAIVTNDDNLFGNTLLEHEEEGEEGLFDNNNNINKDNNLNKNEDVSLSTISTATKGKVLFIDNNNPTPLAKLVLTGIQLGRIIQFYIITSQQIRGIMIPVGMDAKHAALRLSYDLYENFHSCEVIKYNDYKQYSFSLSKVREAGKITTQSKTYIIQDGDIIIFKRTKTTIKKTTTNNDDDNHENNNNNNKKK